MADAEVCSFITKVLCANGGRLAVHQLLHDVRLPEGQLRELLQTAGPDRFVLLDTGDPSGVTEYVVATARVRVCRRKTCQRPCGNLHLCKLNLLHRCRYSERNLCKYSHEIFSEDNLKVLGEHELWGLNEEELSVLLVQNDPFFLPEICKSYKGENRKQICLQQPQCERLHICEHFTRGECSFPNCLRSHNLMDRKVLAVMREHGLSPDQVQNIQDICNSKHSRRRKSAWKGAPAHRRPPRGRDRSREGSREFLSTAFVSSLSSHSPSPDPMDEVSHLTSKFQHLGSQEGSPPVSVSSQGASVGRPGSAEGSQQLLENGSPHCGVPEDSSSRGFSDRDQWKGPQCLLKVQVPKEEGSFPPAFSSVPSAPTSSTTTFQKDEDRLPSELEIWMNRSTPEKPPPFLVDDPLTTELSSTRSFQSRATASREREKASPEKLEPKLSQKNKDRSPSELEIWMNGSTPEKPPPFLVDDPLTTELSSTRSFQSRATASREREKASPKTLEPKLSQKNKDRNPSELEICVNGSALDEPQPLLTDRWATGQPSALHNKATAVKKVKSLVLDHKSLTFTPPRSPGRTADHEGSTAKDHSHNTMDEICLGHLSQGCPLPRSCRKVHFHLPYQWQILTGNTWKELQPLETIEKEYCDPQNSTFTIGNRKINFPEMTCNSVPIRRISTCSSVRAKGSLFTTKWIWYWQDEEGVWIEYGKQEGQHQHVASIDSSYLETIYCFSSGVVVLPFKAGNRNYELNFQAMIQTNTSSRTQKKVLRRPTFTSAWDMEQIKRQLVKSSPLRVTTPSEPLTATPLSQADSLCSNKYQLLELSSQDPEYIQISKSFKASMKNFKIDKIKKILNVKLWDAYCRKKTEKTRNREELLFCAALHSQLASICMNNFSNTVPQPSELKYGMGYYFTKDAFRSHKDSASDPKLSVMIAARVLVGNYTEGSSTFRKPPLGYDSCVDTVRDPSVFVIFQKDQIYPQYVIEYSEGEKACIIS